MYAQSRQGYSSPGGYNSGSYGNGGSGYSSSGSGYSSGYGGGSSAPPPPPPSYSSGYSSGSSGYGGGQSYGGPEGSYSPPSAYSSGSGYGERSGYGGYGYGPSSSGPSERTASGYNSFNVSGYGSPYSGSNYPPRSSSRDPPKRSGERKSGYTTRNVAPPKAPPKVAKAPSKAPAAAAKSNEQKIKENVSDTIWAGDVDPAVSDADFRKVFDSVGTVSRVRRFKDKKYGFVIYAKSEDATTAAKRLQNYKLGTMKLKLELVKPSKSLWIGNVVGLTQEQILQKFSTFGTITSCKVNPESQCAFVNYSSPMDAANAKRELEGTKLGELNLTINFKYDKKSKTGAASAGRGKRKWDFDGFPPAEYGPAFGRFSGPGDRFGPYPPPGPRRAGFGPDDFYGPGEFEDDFEWGGPRRRPLPLGPPEPEWGRRRSAGPPPRRGGRF